MQTLPGGFPQGAKVKFRGRLVARHRMPSYQALCYSRHGPCDSRCLCECECGRNGTAPYVKRSREPCRCFAPNSSDVCGMQLSLSEQASSAWG